MVARAIALILAAPWQPALSWRSCAHGWKTGFALLSLTTGAAVAIAGIGLSERLLDRVHDENGPRAVELLRQWRQLVDVSTTLSEPRKLAAVNDFFNRRVRFVDDQLHWGNEDYWATPVEFLATGGGDCEDFAIAKYYTLRELGVPDDRMRLTYVKALELDQAHMVLAWYDAPNAEPLILDNLVTDIRGARSRRDLKPVYSFNGAGLWSAVTRGQGRRGGGRVGDANQLEPWRRMGLRFEKELAE